MKGATVLAKPVEVFKSDEQFQKLAKEWQHRLFLDHWFISFFLSEEPLEGLEEDNLAWGYVLHSFENSAANIFIFNGKELEEDGKYAKNIAELTLIHELLHLKQEYIVDEDICEGITPFDKALTEQQLEAMAKSLLMAKYGLDYDYFVGTVLLSPKECKVVGKK